MLNWKISKPDALLVNQVVARYQTHFAAELPYPQGDMWMDVCAAHMNGCPLDLEALLAFNNQEFLHDTCGILRHINRQTGELENEFLPRCAKSCGESRACVECRRLHGATAPVEGCEECRYFWNH